MSIESKITKEELFKLFGEGIPMEALKILFESDGKTLGEVRTELRDLAGRKNDLQTILHNAVSGSIVGMIVKPPLQAGGSFTDCLVLMESVLLGVLLVGNSCGYPAGKALEAVANKVGERIASDQLRRAEPQGEG